MICTLPWLDAQVPITSAPPTSLDVIPIPLPVAGMQGVHPFEERCLGTPAARPRVTMHRLTAPAAVIHQRHRVDAPAPVDLVLLGVADALADRADLKRAGAVVEHHAIAWRVVVGLAGGEGAGDYLTKIMIHAKDMSAAFDVCQAR